MIGPNLPHEWRNDDAYFDKESGLRATCICLFFKREIFDPNFIRLPEMNNIRDLIEITAWTEVYRKIEIRDNPVYKEFGE